MCGESKKQQVKEIGAEVVLPREASDLKGLLKAHINDTHVDVVADVVGGPMWGQFIDAIRRGGTYTCAGAIAGPIVELDLRKFYLNNLSFTGATITPPGLFAELVGYIERGEIRPLLSETWPLESLRDAQRSFMQKRHIGKLVAVIDR
jgi:NADPH:quinone reductase-like Zn-dependent oxidoreductase